MSSVRPSYPPPPQLVLSSPDAAPLAHALCNQQNTSKQSNNTMQAAAAAASTTRWRTMLIPTDSGAQVTAGESIPDPPSPSLVGSSAAAAAMTLSSEQRTALSHACALILLYSPSSRASFESLDSLLEAARSSGSSASTTASSSAAVPLQLVSLGIEGDMPVVSTAEGAAWAARVSNSSHQAISFSAVVVCKAQWAEWTAAQQAQEAALAAAEQAERKANTRWWRRLCRTRARSHSSSSASPSSWEAVAPSDSASWSPLSQCVAPSPSLPGEIRAIEDPTPLLPEEAAAAAAAAVAAAPSPASFLELQPLYTPSEADILLAAAAASCSHSHPLPSPTSAEVEELMSSSGTPAPAVTHLTSDALLLLLATEQDSEAASFGDREASSLSSAFSSVSLSLPLRSPPGPRAISATLHVDAASILSPAATKVAHGYSSSPCGSVPSRSGSSTTTSHSSSNSSTRKTSPIMGAPLGAHYHHHAASLCSTAATTPVLRSRKNSHTCHNANSGSNAFSFFTPCYDSCSCSSCHAATLATAAAASAASAAAATAAAAAASAAASLAASTLPSKASAARPVAGERVKKLMCRAWSDGDAERLAAILPISASECAAAAAAATAAAAAAAQATQPIVSPVQVSPSSSAAAAVAAAVAFQHHPTQSPFSRYADTTPRVVSPLSSASASSSASSSSGGAASSEGHVHVVLPWAQPTLSSSSSASRPLPALVAPHSAFSCTCRGTLSFLFDRDHAAKLNVNANNKQWPWPTSENTYVDPAPSSVCSPPPLRYSPLHVHTDKARVNLGLFAAALVLLLVLLFARSLLLLHDPDAPVQLTAPTSPHTPQLAIAVRSQALPNHQLIT